MQAISREQLSADRDRFARQARIDPLTGLENRAAWDEHVQAEEARRSRYARSVTVVSADLDNLKAVNDRYGHEAGDRLIRAAANLLRRHARGADRIARVGGDEFLILMPETDMRGAGRYLARVRAAIRRIQEDRSVSPATVVRRCNRPGCRIDRFGHQASRRGNVRREEASVPQVPRRGELADGTV